MFTMRSKLKYEIIEKSGSVITVNRVEIGRLDADSLYIATLYADN